MARFDEALFNAVAFPVIAIADVASAAAKAKDAIVNKIDDVRCELHNRRNFDKKHPHLAPKK